MNFSNIFSALSPAIVLISGLCICFSSCSEKEEETKVPLEGIALVPESVEIIKGEALRIEVNLIPENAAEPTLSWSSSEPDIVFVDKDGNITGRSAGKATITASAGPIQSNCAVTVQEVLPQPQVGDYFYSDGTWSSRINFDKKPIAVIFWTGNPTSDDATLAADHPECTHGLAVALTEESGSSLVWQNVQGSVSAGKWIEANTDFISILCPRAGSSTNGVNKILGYNNTKALEAYNAAPENSGTEVGCVSSLEEYRKTVAAPEGSSGWYLPSIKELSLLCTGTFDDDILKINDVDYNISEMTRTSTVINAKLDKLSGASKTNGYATYWSSTEDTDQSAYQLYFFNGQVYSWPKSYAGGANSCRYVLAF